MDERLEWLKAQIEAYQKDTEDGSWEWTYDRNHVNDFLRYMENKFKVKGIFER